VKKITALRDLVVDFIKYNPGDDIPEDRLNDEVIERLEKSGAIEVKAIRRSNKKGGDK
jgi:hypothetical protein